ncbi:MULTISPECIES: MBL fold metallo-hydrolase [unclassified Nonomuraea]|uniref:MBL fold metallo-hydrolase n=1 Tax=unclassified Nonomuraea TaxID=2593643 RepID=UPI0033C0CF2A
MRSPSTGTPGAISWTVGDITIHRVDEIALPPQTGAWLLPGATADVVARHAWLRPDFADRDGVLRLVSQSFAISADGLRILVDTGIGNGKTRANPAWHDLRTGYLDRLVAAGFPPESVDMVILTHLHTDHVGWNTRAEGGEWVPTFPRARYLTSRAERDFWAGCDMDEARRQMFRDSVHPIEEAGLLDLVPVPAEVALGVHLVSTPGHTPGHVAVRLTSGGESALITGDCVHHPVQLLYPDIGSCVDIDPEQATATRRALLASLAGTGALVLGTHFPPPTAGRLIADGPAYRLVPVPPAGERSPSRPEGGRPGR